MSGSSLTSKLVQNFLSLSSAEVFSKLVTLATFAFVARVVGPQAFGNLEFAFSIVFTGLVLVDQGSSVFGAREIARSTASTTLLVAEVTSLRLTLGAIIYAGFVLIVWLLDRPAEVESLILLFGLSVFLMPFMLPWVFQGYDRMGTVGVMQIVRQSVLAIIVFSVLQNRAVLWPVAVGELCGAASVMILSLWLYRSQLGLRFTFKFRISTQLFRAAGTIGLGQLFWSLRMYGPTIVIGLIGTEADVGFFGSAMRIAIGINAFVWLYFFNLWPSMSRAWTNDLDEFRNLIGQSLRTVGWLALFGSTLWVLLAPFCIQLMYGEAYLPATTALRWMSGLVILSAIHSHFGFGLIAADQQRYATAATGIGTLVALATVPFGYINWGISGATIALIIGEAAVWASAFLFSRQRIELRSSHRHLVRPAIGAVILIGILSMLPQSTPLAGQIAIVLLGFSALVLIIDYHFRAALRQQLFGHRSDRMP